MDAVAVVAGGFGAAGADRVAGRRGVAVKDIVERVGVSKPTVIGVEEALRGRGHRRAGGSAEAGPAGAVDEVAVVLATLEPPPERLGVTHWSSRLLADHLAIGPGSRTCGSARSGAGGVCSRGGGETFKFSTDPSWRPRSATSSGCT